jgi:VCBS repeat-containing protein
MSRDSNDTKGLSRSVLFCWIPGILLFLFFFATSSYSRDVTFIWTANPENVDGYKLYYKTGSSGPPYDGTGATQGASPLQMGNVTTYTLSNLSDSQTYYFALTAYLGAEESAYSTEIVLPADTPDTAGRDVTFVWTANQDNVDGYRLYYKTGSSGPPYDGTGAAEGSSPIATGNVTSFTIHDLQATETYYFALTAYEGTSESAYSDELVLPAGQVNNPPTANGATITVVEDTPYYGQLTATDADGDPLTYSIVTGGEKGAVVITNSSSGTFSYTPYENENGSDSFIFRVSDGMAYSANATVNISISAVNDPPLAEGAAIVVIEDTPYSGQLVGSDVDGDSLSYRIVSNGSLGTATITNSSTGMYTYVPNTNANGTDSFTFVVNDGVVDSLPATISITILAVNDPPVAEAATFTVNENSSLSGQLSGSDPDGDPLTFAIVTNGSKGNAVITNPSTGAFTYTPNADATGSDSFTFRVNDGALDSQAATVSINIAAVNEAPVANNASIGVSADAVYTGVLSASDSDGDALTYRIITNSTKGSAVITNQATGAFTYTPNPGESGADSFTFRANDGVVDSNTATVSVTIVLVNTAPVASNISISTNENTPYTGHLSASDADGDSLTFSIVTNPGLGSAVITNQATGAFNYTPNSGVSGSDSFTFKANDGVVDSNVATVNVTIVEVNDPPTAENMAIVTDRNVALSGQLSGSDPDGDALTYSIVSNGAKGTAEITNPGSGAFTYTPATNEFGDDAFTFKVNDGTVDSGVATVSITINAANELPVAFDGSITVEYNTEFAGQLMAHDPDGDPLTYTIVTNPSLGSVAMTDTVTGAFTYTPGADTAGADSFTFIVNDGLEDSTPATVTVEILAESVLIAVFGDNYGADYPGTVADTFAKANTDLSSSTETLRTHSVASSPPHKPANTIIMKVDLADIPTYATIVDARLILYQTAAEGATQYLNSVHRITGPDPVIISEVNGFNASEGMPWTPVGPGQTYNDVPLGLADIGPAEDEQILLTQPDYRTWEITEMVQDWVSMPSANRGLLIKGEETAVQTGRVFASSENSNTAIRPQVIVYYRLIPRPPRLIMVEEIK